VHVFVVVLAVPALLVVLLGYVVGYQLWAWLGGLLDDAYGTSLADGAEAVGWITGLLTLAGAVWALARRRRSRRRRG
jgi:xanthosine utilization system XapX-like protein